MSQKDILDYLFKVKRPVQKKELNFLMINKISINRNLSKLERFGLINSKTLKNRRKTYFLK